MITARVYCLINPNTQNPIYVGVTFLDLEERLRQHKSQINKGSTRLYKYLRDNSIIPFISLLEELEVEDRYNLCYREIEWVSELTNKGFDLLNKSPVPRVAVFISKAIYDEIYKYLDAIRSLGDIDNFVEKSVKQSYKRSLSINRMWDKIGGSFLSDNGWSGNRCHYIRGNEKLEYRNFFWWHRLNDNVKFNIVSEDNFMKLLGNKKSKLKK